MMKKCGYLFNRTELNTAETLELQCQFLSFLVLYNINIGFLTDTYFSSNRNNVSSLHHRAESKKVIAKIGQSVTIVSAL